MKREHNSGGPFCRWFSTGSFLLILMLPGLTGCKPKTPQAPSLSSTPAGTPVALAGASDSLRIILLPVAGDSHLDREIAGTQQMVRQGGPRMDTALEHLGWLFVAKARVSFDPGYYKLAEQTALCMENRKPHSLEAMLLRGHVLDNLHKFKEAEPLARELVERRGMSFDYGLLGDVLMEQGRLDEAVAAYQKMADLEPDIHAYTRAAHVRWLTGDLTGAIQAMQMALQATTPRDPETAAWVYTHMALYQLQIGRIDNGLAHCDVALQFQKDYPPALLAKGRLLLAEGHNEEAVKALRLAEKLNPLPEYQWALIEALQTLGQSDAALEKDLNEHGTMTDPRTYALYLATRGQDPATALRLAQAEFETRQDVFTHDALAWAWMESGDYSLAGAEINRALSAGTQDARLFLHAGIINEKLGRKTEASQLFAKAEQFKAMLLPSERATLAGHSSTLALNRTKPGETAFP